MEQSIKRATGSRGRKTTFKGQERSHEVNIISPVLGLQITDEQHVVTQSLPWKLLSTTSYQLVPIKSLPFLHTARRYYRLNGSARPSDWPRRMKPGWIMLLALISFTLSLENIFTAIAPVQQTYWGLTFATLLVLPWGMDMSFPVATS